MLCEGASRVFSARAMTRHTGNFYHAASFVALGSDPTEYHHSELHADESEQGCHSDRTRVYRHAADGTGGGQPGVALAVFGGVGNLASGVFSFVLPVALTAQRQCRTRGSGCHGSRSCQRPGTKNHVDNMWLLGGEIIRDVNENPSLRKVAAEKLVRDVIHEDGGPLIHNGWEDEQRAFDSTCRKFYRFLTQPQR
jgi:hypothetical protein